MDGPGDGRGDEKDSDPPTVNEVTFATARSVMITFTMTYHIEFPGNRQSELTQAAKESLSRCHGYLCPGKECSSAKSD